MFDRFLDRFGHRLSIDYGKRYNQHVEDRAEVFPLDEFTRTRFDCGSVGKVTVGQTLVRHSRATDRADCDPRLTEFRILSGMLPPRISITTALRANSSQSIVWTRLTGHADSACRRGHSGRKRDLSRLFQPIQ